MRVAYFVIKYPTLSQTFIDREMRALNAQPALEVEVHPILDFGRRAAADPPGLPVVRVRFWRLLGSAVIMAWRERSKWSRAFSILIKHRPRTMEAWFHTLWGTLFALGRAQHFRDAKVDAFHGAWATAPATVAMVLAALCDKPFSFGAHAYDVHRHGGDPLLAAKLASARFVHTTTQANVSYLERTFPERRARIVLARRGLARMPPPVERQPRAGEPLHILSVGRLVEKKGHVFQLAACRELLRRGSTDFRLKIIGDGPLRVDLMREIAAGGLSSRVELAGPQEPAAVEAAYLWADVFWHTGIVDAEGDRDGLPNVVPEAMAHGLAVISSSAGGASEAITGGESGLIVENTDDGAKLDPAALADAIELLARDPGLRVRLGEASRIWVEANFLAEKNTARLAEAFRGGEAASLPPWMPGPVL